MVNIKTGGTYSYHYATNFVTGAFLLSAKSLVQIRHIPHTPIVK
jgi:hypothetical protein